MDYIWLMSLGTCAQTRAAYGSIGCATTTKPKVRAHVLTYTPNLKAASMREEEFKIRISAITMETWMVITKFSA